MNYHVYEYIILYSYIISNVDVIFTEYGVKHKYGTISVVGVTYPVTELNNQILGALLSKTSSYGIKRVTGENSFHF